MLRRKVLSQILAIECITLLLFLASFFIIYNNYKRIEEEQLQLNIVRVTSALNREIDNLGQIAFEWSSTGLTHWTTESDSELDFVNSVIDIILVSLPVDKALIFKLNGSLLVGKERIHVGGIQIEKELSEFSPFLESVLIQSGLTNLGTHNIHTNGLAFLDGITYLVSSYPILPDRNAITHQGSLVLVTTFDLSALANLSDMVHQSVEILPLVQLLSSADSEKIINEMSNDINRTAFSRVSSTQIDTYTMLENFSGDYSFVLKLSSQRKFIRQAIQSMIYIGVGLILLFALLALYILFFLDRSILKKLQSISIAINNFTPGLQGQRLTISGKDEISAFASAFNNALDSLDQSQSALKNERDLAETTLASIGEAVITTDKEGHICYMNKVAEQITGHRCHASIGKDLELVFHPTDDAGNTQEVNLALQCVISGKNISENSFCYLIDESGNETVVESLASPLCDHNHKVNGAVLVLRDVTDAKSLQKNLIYQASHDGLTDLLNRSEFERQLSIISNAASMSDQNHHLIFVDLDRFKIVNDSCGHIAGDKVLREIAQLMKGQIRKNDILARIGGDEFGIILTDCKFQHAYEIAETLREVISSFKYQFNEKVFTFGASMGLVNLKDQSLCLEGSALSNADAACMAAKNSGRNRVYIFKQRDEDLNLHQQQTQWVTRITEALEKDRFTLFFQKIVDISGAINTTPNAEILLRMMGSEGEIIAPGAFLPAAERYGLMKFIDKWVFEHFCTWLIDHPSDARVIDTFSINLSGQSLNDVEFLGYLSSYISDKEFLTRKICFEITETAAIHNLSNTSRFINILKKMGCKFLLDDFGSGMSSFGYLKHLPVDVIKIDGQFIKNIAQQPIDLAMVKSINEIGHLMNIKSVAEFVENEDILTMVTEIGVDYAQGYHIHKPEALGNLVTGYVRTRKLQ